MSDLKKWELRSRGADKVTAISADQLADLFVSKIVGEAHEVRVAGTSEWLSIAQALPFLPTSAKSSDGGQRAETPETVDLPRDSELEDNSPNLPPTPPPPPPSVTRKRRTGAAPIAPHQPSSPPVSSETPNPGRWKTQDSEIAEPSPNHDEVESQPKAKPASTKAAPAKPKTAPQAGSKPSAKKTKADLVKSASSSVSVPVVPTPDLPVLPKQRNDRRGSLGGKDDELEMTPMIDMTFLLLIFFMVTSTISPYADLQLPEARSGDAECPEGRVVLVLDYPTDQPDGDTGQFTGSEFIELSDCLLYLADQSETPIPPDQLQPALERAFENNLSGEFILQSNRKMPVGVVRQIIKTAKNAGAGDTMIGVARPR